MDNMDKETEWLESSIKENTKLHHIKAISYLKEYMKMTPEEILELRQKEGKRFNTRIVIFWKSKKTWKKSGKRTLTFSVLDLD